MQIDVQIPSRDTWRKYARTLNSKRKIQRMLEMISEVCNHIRFDIKLYKCVIFKKRISYLKNVNISLHFRILTII